MTTTRERVREQDVHNNGHAGGSSRAEDSGLPPHNMDAELALCSLLLTNSAAAIALLPTLDPLDFFAPTCRRILEAARAVDAGGAIVDLATIQAEMVRRGTWESSEEAVREIAARQVEPGNAPRHLELVKSLRRSRELLVAAARTRDALLGGEPVEQVATRLRIAVDNVEATETAEPTGMGEPLTVDEVLAKAGDKVKCLVHGYIPENSVVMLSGGSGAGKSYLLAYLLSCGERGLPFLTHPIEEKFEALWYTEEPASFLAQKIRRFDLRSVSFYGRDHLDVAPPWPELVAEGAERARRMGKRILVVDPFPTWAQHDGDAEQSSGAMTQALRPCLAAAKDGLVVVLTTHDTRAGNPFRGSGAIKGALDVGLWLRLLDPRKPDGPRVLSIEKDRPYFATPQATLTLDGGGYRLLGDPLEAQAREHVEAARAELRLAGEEGLSATTLGDVLGIRKELALRVVRLVATPKGKGARTRWILREDQP